MTEYFLASYNECLVFQGASRYFVFGQKELKQEFWSQGALG